MPRVITGSQKQLDDGRWQATTKDGRYAAVGEDKQEAIQKLLALIDASEGPATYEEALDQQIAELRELLIDKHRQYGTNLSRNGLHGIRVRIDDKVARLINLEILGADDADPRFVEPFIDLAGYAIQALLINKGQYELHLDDGRGI